MRIGRAAIVGAGGPTGSHLARELVARDIAVRAVGRKAETLRLSLGDLPVERVAADALDPQAMRVALEGCDLVVDCIGLPPERMADHPATARAIVAACGRARCLQVSSYWAFLPTRREVIDESHPRAGGHWWFRMRRRAEDEILAAGGAVVHLPDFFGPRVHTSSVQNALKEAVAGKPVPCIGSPDTGRDSVFVPDAMRVVADLACSEAAYGTDWGLGGNAAVSARQLAELASARLSRPVGVRAAPAWVIRLLALFTPSLRPLVPLLGHYSRPVRYDTTKLERLLGRPRFTPLPEAVSVTIDGLVEEMDRPTRTAARPD